MNQRDEEEAAARPKVAAEVRAWIVTAITLVMYLVGTVWWAATLSERMSAMSNSLNDLRTQIAGAYSAADASRDLQPLRERGADHEARLRLLESEHQALKAQQTQRLREHLNRAQ